VGPDLTSLPRTTACPACGGALRPEATWCSLCFFDFRSAAAPAAPAPEPVTQVPAYGVLDPLTAPLLDLAVPPVAPLAVPQVVVPAEPPAGEDPQPSWPCARCGGSNALDSPVCATCGAGFLAHALEKPRLVLPLVGDFYAMSRGRRAGLAAAAVLAVILPLAILTLVLTGAPPSTSNSPSGTTTVVTTAP